MLLKEPVYIDCWDIFDGDIKEKVGEMDVTYSDQPSQQLW